MSSHQKVVQRPQQVGVATAKVDGRVLQPMFWELVGCHLIENPGVLLVDTKNVGNGHCGKNFVATLVGV